MCIDALGRSVPGYLHIPAVFFAKNIREEKNMSLQKTAEQQRAAVQNSQTMRMVKLAMLVAISIVLVYLVRFPIFPAVAFLEYDPADISILIGTFAFGPAAGVLLTLLVSVIQGLTVSAGSGLYGILMHVIATGALVLVAGGVYQKHKTRKMALGGLLLGMMVMSLMMLGANLIITPLFMGVPRSAVWGLMPFIIGFNFIKAGINGAVTFLVYKRVAAFLRK